MKRTTKRAPDQPHAVQARLPACTTQLREAYRLLRAHFGHRHWWPAETRFEVCVGAILTQNTAWENVRRAIEPLKAHGLLAPHKLYALPPARLARWIRPAGYFNLKARRLRAFLKVLVEEYGGDLDRLFAGPTAKVRERLLQIHGIGPETADSMLLYAGGHLVFVVDAYTRRILARHEWCAPDADYHELQALLSAALSRGPRAQRMDYWQDYHAQLVAAGNAYCRNRRPRCEACPLAPLLPKSGPKGVTTTRADRRRRLSKP